MNVIISSDNIIFISQDFTNNKSFSTKHRITSSFTARINHDITIKNGPASGH